MKKIITLITLSLITVKSFSQFTYGISGGINVSYIIEDVKQPGINSTYNTDVKVRPDIGFFFQIPIGEKGFMFQPEIHYSMMGAKDDSADLTAAVDLNYINLPLLFKYKFNKGVGLFAGPQFGFLVKQRASLNTITVDINSYKSNSVSFALGLDYTFRFGLSISVNSQGTLGNILKSNPELEGIRHNLTNSRISVGYILGETKKKNSN